MTAAQWIDATEALPADGSGRCRVPALVPILTRAINWDLIGQQYDEM